MPDMLSTILDELQRLKVKVARLETLEQTAGNADTVDGIHAATTATANELLALNASSKLPTSITGDADTVDGNHAAAFLAVGATATDSDKVDGKHATGVMSAVYSGLSAVDYPCAAASGVAEIDTTLTVSFTPALTSNVAVICSTMFESNTSRSLACLYDMIMDGVTVAGSTRNFSAVAGNRVPCTVVTSYANVTAAAHTMKLRITRSTDTDVVTNRWRSILVIVTPA